MSIRNSGLKLLDKFRAKLDYQYNLRQHDVVMRVTTYPPGSQIGDSAGTHVDTLVGIKGLYRPKVENVSTKDANNSGGIYTNLDIKVGPLTPTYPTGGDDPSEFSPVYDATLIRDIKYKVTGPGMPNGDWFVKIGQELDNSFSYYIILRKTQSSS